MKKTISAFMSLIIIIITVAFPVASSEVTGVRLDNTKVADDLDCMIINGKKFNKDNYPKNEASEYMSMISLTEYGYDYSGDQSNYMLYFYLYNPSGKNISDNTQNQIQLAAVLEDGNVPVYRKYQLTLVDKTNDNVFLKFRLINLKVPESTKHICNIVDPECRIYKVSGIEIKTGNQSNATEYKVSGTYKFTGYMKGFRQNKLSESTLLCSVNELLTVDLTLHGTYYRPDVVNQNGQGHRNEIDSVYFSVDENLFKNYGKLYSIQGSYYEYRIQSIVTECESFYEQWKNTIGQAYTYDKTKIGSYLYNSTPYQNGYYYYDQTFNYSLNDNQISWNKLTKVPYIFYVSELINKVSCVSSDDVKSTVQKYGIVGTACHDGNLVNYDISFDDYINLESYGSTQNWWANVWAKLLWGENTDTTYNIAPITEITTTMLLNTDKALSESIYVDESDISELRREHATAKLNNQRLILFHFAVSDAYTQTAGLVSNNSGVTITNNSDQETLIYEQSYFKDFDVISLTFEDDYTMTVVPVVTSPIDVVGDVTPTIDKTSADDWLDRLIALLMIVLLIVILMPVITKLFDYMVQGTGKTIKKIKSKKRRRK